MIGQRHCIGNTINAPSLLWVIWQHNQNKAFPDKALWNHLLTVCDAATVRSRATSALNKCFFVNSPWHCASFKKQNAPFNPQTWSRMPFKINYPLFPYAGILQIFVQRRKRAVYIKPVKTNILSLWLSYWQQNQACVRKWTRICVLYPV